MVGQGVKTEADPSEPFDGGDGASMEVFRQEHSPDSDPADEKKHEEEQVREQAPSIQKNKVDFVNPHHGDHSHHHHHHQDHTDRGSVTQGSVTVRSLDQHSDQIQQELAHRESHQIRYLKILLSLILLLAAGGTCAAMYTLTRRAETEEFETEYDSIAARVLTSYEQIVSEKLGAVASLAVAATSYAQATNETWPQVTLNDFDYRTASILTQADCLLLQILPKVEHDQRQAWETYSATNLQWYYEGLQRQAQVNAAFTQLDAYNFPFIFHYTFDPVEMKLGIAPNPEAPQYAPVWQHAPLLPAAVNLNALSYAPYQRAIDNALATGRLSLGGVFFGQPGNISSEDVTTQFYALLLSLRAKQPVEYKGEPMSYTAYPIFDTNDVETRKPVATIGMAIHWNSYFKEIVPPETAPVTVVLENECDGPFTFLVDNENVEFLGAGDKHDTAYNHLERQAALNSLYASTIQEHAHKLELDELDCPFRIRVYPTSEMEDDNRTHIPLITTIAVGIAFIFTAAIFFLYNRLVERRQKIVLTQATQSTAIVSSFLPDAVQERLLAANDDGGDMLGDTAAGDHGNHTYSSPMSRLKNFLSEGQDNRNAKPIADLFPYTTVLFADIEGFTAWSSTREPAQVFVLLQTVYQSFDAIAKRNKVFKVETIGDSYVAATGIPNDQPRHAVNMARFAWQCLLKMQTLCKELEVQLGPDTGDLAMRFGIHSGPVTAGVLRGERPRFQLFGDTVNTASRMESTGMRNRIQVSYATAAELEKHNKGHWLCKRMDEVSAKGKGVLETYWLEISSRDTDKSDKFDGGSQLSLRSETPAAIQERRGRLIEWCVELLSDHLRRVVARRQGLFLNQTADASSLVFKPADNQTCLDEVQESMTMPKYDPKEAGLLAKMDHRNVELPDSVISQLREYITVMAGAYRNNPFHCFEHAAHVTMSVDKFLKRIVSPDMEKGDRKSLHEYTHGLTSDPLVLMAIVWSALIHDVDHRGISNAQLAKEEEAMANSYNHKSVAEQNSLDLSWDFLMRSDFADLRKMMFTDRNDLLRFRQIIVNVVLATDIFDKELNDLRKSRWSKAFDTTAGAEDDNLRATIVMEHIIQASDVCHTMQHWMIYRKWNARLFEEMHKAYRQGRMEKDPATFWYQGELGFFDHYIIPLAKKLKDCNVFGVSSDECLCNATQNRREWEQRGQQIVAELKARVEQDEGA